MKPRQLVFVNQSSGYLMVDIIHAFEDKYSERVLITGFLNPRNKPLDPRVKVEGMIPYDRSSSIRRVWSWGIGFLKVLWLIKTKYRNADLFLVSNPPFATLIPLFCSNKYKILIYDIYPDALVEFGYFKKDSFAVRLWGKANKKVYSASQKVYTLTEGMKSRMLNYVAADKIQVVPIWTDNDFLKPILKSENPIFEELGWEGKFIVMYSGNLGKSHPVEIMVDLAKMCKVPEIQFVIIGGGDKFEMIQALIKKSNSGNIQLLPWQPTQKLPFTLAAAHLGVVTISDEAADLSIPSKTFNLMSVGVPILGISPDQSALSELIHSEEIGKSFNSKSSENMIMFIEQLYENPDLHNKLSIKSMMASNKFTVKNTEFYLADVS